MIKSIIKRDGSRVPFDSLRITNAIIKAMNSVDAVDNGLAIALTREVVSKLKGVPRINDIQEVIIKVLKDKELFRVAQSYEIYMSKRALARELKISDELKLSANALIVLERRYLQPGETPRGLFRRVAKAVAKAESKFGGDARASEEQFFNLMKDLEFLPNSPTLMNAGTKLGQLSACYVLPINDSLESIFDTLKESALIHHAGGGVGFNFSNLRPKGDLVKSTSGAASGPVSFIKVFDATTDVIKQGGRRRGANMAVIDCDHPDVLEFINAKRSGGFTNFNFSVSLTDSFMRGVISDGSYWFVNPRNKEKVKRVKAREVFMSIVNNAWSGGEPGVLFIDEINRKHPLKDRISCVNPCGEAPLLNYESCNLGSINLSKMVNNDIDWVKLERVTRLAVRFLDDVIEVNEYPLDKVREVTLANRKIGLGVMGFADMLIKLGVPYDSDKAVSIAERVMSFIQNRARDESMKLGLKRGSFPNFKKSKIKSKAMRNATVTTIAPTGSISIIADCSSSIEPLFALSFTRNVMNHTNLPEVNKYFEKLIIKQGLYSKKLVSDIARNGSVQDTDLPIDVKRVFRVAFDIKPEWHVKMQAAFQKHVDNAVSKTVNLPFKATIDDAAKVFLMAYKFKCKGITMYRYGSKSEQVLYLSCKPNGECD